MAGPGNPPCFAPIHNGSHMTAFWEKGMAYLKPGPTEATAGADRLASK